MIHSIINLSLSSSTYIIKNVLLQELKKSESQNHPCINRKNKNNYTKIEENQIKYIKYKE